MAWRDEAREYTQMCDIGRQQQIECYVNALCMGRSFFAITCDIDSRCWSLVCRLSRQLRGRTYEGILRKEPFEYHSTLHGNPKTPNRMATFWRWKETILRWSRDTVHTKYIALIFFSIYFSNIGGNGRVFPLSSVLLWPQFVMFFKEYRDRSPRSSVYVICVKCYTNTEDESRSW